MIDVTSYKGANVDTDHYLVITRIRAKKNVKVQFKQRKMY
jgi:hypothetical protein